MFVPRKRASMRSRFLPPASSMAAIAAPVGVLAPPDPRTALNVFFLLTAINFLNYLDRFIFVAVSPVLRSELHLSATQVGQTTSAFLLIYTLTALPMGLLADRGSRTRIIAFGVVLWSLATWYTAYAQGFTELFIGRALLGIGEASYVPAGLALLGAYFAPQHRARVMSWWGIGTLVGTALGFILGGVIAHHFGWRTAFLICGPPGLILGWLIWRAPDRAAYDRHDGGMTAAERPRLSFATLVGQARAALSSPTVRFAIVIQALGFFFTTPAIIFIPIYLHEHFRVNIQTTALIAGGILIPGGVLGTLLGGVLADRLSRRFAGGRMMAVAISFTGAAPLFLLALLARSLPLMLALTFIATVFVNIFNGPLNAIIQDVTPARLRASAAALILTLAHLAGDVTSPTLVGNFADRMHRLGTAGSLIVLGCPALVLGAIVALISIRYYVRELAARDPESEPDDSPQLALAH